MYMKKMTEPIAKRPKLRTLTSTSATGQGSSSSTTSSSSLSASALAAKKNQFVSSEFLVDFPRAFLQDEEVSAKLDTLIHCRKITSSGVLNDDGAATSQAPSKALPKVPLQFETAKQYAEVFQPLMLEEAKTDMFSHLGGTNIRRIGFELTSRTADEREDDSCFSTSTRGEPTFHCRLRANVRLPERNKGDWWDAEKQIKRILSDGPASPCGLSQLQRGDVLILLHSHMARRPAGYYETDSRLAALGIVSRAARPVPPTAQDIGGIEIDVAVTSTVAGQLRNIPVTAYYIDDCNLMTTWREWDGMNALLSAKPIFGSANWSSPLIPFLLSGTGSPNATAASSSPDSPALIELRNVAQVDPNLPLSLPGATPRYQQELRTNYNSSQIEAIAAASSAKSGFVLVQGPPGTGKTHTLLGLLNSLHLAVSQQCYEQGLPDPLKTDNPIPENLRFDWMKDKSNPHLLVVAPSNAAIDNVLRLVLTKGFLDGTGNRYKPHCVRIGSSNWNNARSQNDLFNACSLDKQVDALMALRGKGDSRSQSETDDLARRLRGREAEIRALTKRLAELANEHAASPSTDKLKAFHEMAASWVANRNQARDLALALEKRRLLFSQGSEKALRDDMRALVLTQANLVFATLSQCGSAAMVEIAPARVKFQVCVVDEAGQAVEPSTIVPLSLGVERCVMVGDPNQLPATVLSDRATRARYQQSLFERLQRCGHPVHLLDVQYRCRPELSSFCSRMFYSGRLKDGENVRNPSYALPMYRFPCFGPLVFFDVSHGSQVRSSASSSLSNDAEADVCLDLYRTLRDPRMAQETVSPLTGSRCHIAVISPYREQLSLLQSRLPRNDPLLETNTVDGFQGREVDVVIFSCVRAHASASTEDGSEDGGIGFLNDARRLNVAETRARFSFLIVGNGEVLRRGSRLWKDLLGHVQARGRTIKLSPGKFDYLTLASS